MLRVQPIFVNPVNNFSIKHKPQNDNFHKEVVSGIDYNVNYNNNLANTFNKEKLLQNYETAREYFNYNFEHKKPIFGSVEESKLIETNPLVKKNFCKFMVEKSSSELTKLYKSGKKSPDTDFQIKGYTQLNKFFKEYLELLEEDKYLTKDIGFSGKLSKEKERYCKNLIHGYAAACSLVSAGAGAFSLGSSDVWVLRPLQGFMFISMQDYLQVPFWAAAEYTAKEMYSAAVLGTEGAKIVVDLLGWATHATSAVSGVSAASGGTSHLGIAKASAAAHGSLSFMLTEKMGRGFLKRVRQNKMTLEEQTAEFASYFGIRAALGGISDLSETFSLGHNTISDSFDPEMIKKAYDAVPKPDKEVLSSIMELLSDYNVSKLGYSFAFNFGAKMLSNFKKFQDNNDGYRKKMIEDAFKDAFLLTAIYDIFDLGVGSVISHNAADTIKNMQNNLEDYPEVFKVFKESEAKMFDNIDLEKLDEKEFRKMFTNKTFLSNLSIITKEQVKEFIDVWISKDFHKNREAENRINSEKGRLSQKTQELVEKENKISQNLVNDVMGAYYRPGGALNPKNNFGYGKIAGYKDILDRITAEFITSISMEQKDRDNTPMEGMLLYGPTNTGKTTLASAVIEQSMSEIENSFENYLPDDFLYKKLCKLEQQAKQTFDEKNRRTIIQFDEIDSLSDKPKTLAKLKELISDGDNRISVVGTTNSPDKVDKELVSNFLKLYVGPASLQDMKSIMEYYLNDTSKQNLDIDKICQILDSKDSGRFSNNQLRILCNVINKKNLPTEKVLSMVETMSPEISNKKIASYDGGFVNA